MAKSKQQKSDDLAELTEKLKTVKGAVLVDYRGTTVKNIDKFRRTLGKEGVSAKVYKVSLLKKAFEANGINADAIDYKAPIMFTYSDEEETTPARIAKKLSAEIKTIAPVSGLLDGKMVDKNMVLALADLPSKQELLGKLVGTINAPVSGFVNVLAGNIRSLVNVLNAIASK